MNLSREQEVHPLIVALRRDAEPLGGGEREERAAFEPVNARARGGLSKLELLLELQIDACGRIVPLVESVRALDDGLRCVPIRINGERIAFQWRMADAIRKHRFVI